jgi:hypothetical protein
MRKAISCLGLILPVVIVLAGCGGRYELNANAFGDKHGPGFSDYPRQSPDGSDRALF